MRRGGPRNVAFWDNDEWWLVLLFPSLSSVQIITSTIIRKPLPYRWFGRLEGQAVWHALCFMRRG